MPTNGNVSPTTYWEGSHQLIDLGFDNWGIACNVAYKISTHLSFNNIPSISEGNNKEN